MSADAYGDLVPLRSFSFSSATAELDFLCKDTLLVSDILIFVFGLSTSKVPSSCFSVKILTSFPTIYVRLQIGSRFPPSDLLAIDILLTDLMSSVPSGFSKSSQLDFITNTQIPAIQTTELTKIKKRVNPLQSVYSPPTIKPAKISAIRVAAFSTGTTSTASQYLTPKLMNYKFERARMQPNKNRTVIRMQCSSKYPVSANVYENLKAIKSKPIYNAASV